MRKAYDGLCGEVVSFMKQEPTSGHLFVFVNKRRDRMKILVWDRHGFWLLCKRLEAGRFQLPALHDSAQRSCRRALQNVPGSGHFKVYHPNG
jgi:transposase